jgi:hypothetical protein
LKIWAGCTPFQEINGNNTLITIKSAIKIISDLQQKEVQTSLHAISLLTQVVRYHPEIVVNLVIV